MRRAYIIRTERTHPWQDMKRSSDGQYYPASSAKSFSVRNPYTNNIVGYAASATSQDCTNALTSAGRAFPSWEATPHSQRRDIFLKAADLVSTTRYKEKITKAMREETAATDSMVFMNIRRVGEQLKDAAGLVSGLKGETFASALPEGYVVVQRRAMGVIFAISPWNVPVILTIRAVAVPIICGNTVVLKCSEKSPRSQSIVAELLKEAGLPPGVLNFVSMDRQDAPELTAEIIAHPLVRKINFTGSDGVGKIIAAEAAKYLKPCVFELGGKAPVVVLDDADMEKAARAIASSTVLHSGQLCMSTERVIIQRQISTILIPALIKLLSSVKAGDPLTDREAKLSALFTEDSARNVISMIEEANAAGATVLLGDVKRDGAVVQPHILNGVKPGMRLWDKECFGPVIVIAVADTLDEIVDLANASSYSLMAGLWTRDVNVALGVAARIRAGCTNINGPTVHVEPQRGYAGLGGASGYGHFDVDNFTDARMVVVHPSEERAYPVVG
ncbi:unnamed protein product [Somion occarium]|uniref:Aldehyde dehydrogenase domain-containing protein n=1 Tax=Somion occarium TaxID=3059160 RepID=A0ABP1E5A7_9APHY